MAQEHESSLGKAYDARLVRRLLPYAKAHKRLLVLSIVLVLVQVAVEQISPLIWMSAIGGPVSTIAEAPNDPAAWESLHFLVLMFVIVLAFEMCLRFFSSYSLIRLGQKIVFDLRSHLYGHLQQMPLRFYDKRPVGLLVTRTTSDIEAIGEVFSSGLVTMLADILKILVILGILFALNWELAAIILLVFPIMFAITAIFRVRARMAYRAMRARVAVLNAFLVEALGGLMVTRIFAREKQQESRYKERNLEYRAATLETVQNFAIFFPIVEFIATASVGLLLWYGYQQILGGTLGADVFTTFFIFTQRLFRPIRELSERYTILQGAMASTERVFGLIDEQNELVDPDSPVDVKPKSFRGEIEFRNVWFAYNDEEWVLKDVSFKVEPGNSLALVGATGSGKSTIINLICRFYDIQRGQILIDGVDIKQMRRSDLRSFFGLVAQDVFLFAGTVLENLRLGDESISRQRVVDAAKATGADGFISRLPHGIDSEMAERGATFSTGQKQLIAFSRALAFDPPLLILDEATAHIDSETEAQIQKAIEKVMEGRTTLAVAHRLSTIQHANEILVLHKGEIVERGKHEELLAQKGRYHRLYMLQFGASESLLADGAGKRTIGGTG